MVLSVDSADRFLQNVYESKIIPLSEFKLNYGTQLQYLERENLQPKHQPILGEEIDKNANFRDDLDLKC